MFVIKDIGCLGQRNLTKNARIVKKNQLWYYAKAMDISYLGHSSFKLRGKQAAVVTDPYESKIGFPFPRVSADIVTISHDHDDHNNAAAVLGTARRKEPFVIAAPGEYDVSGISVFGAGVFHDNEKGAKRGRNTIFSIQIDGVSVIHLGDLGHKLSEKKVEEMGEVDVVLLPIGGVYTIGPKEAIEVISELQPAYVIPMHYRTKKHNSKTFGELSTLEDFLKEGGFEQAERVKKLSVVKSGLPDEVEVVVLST